MCGDGPRACARPAAAGMGLFGRPKRVTEGDLRRQRKEAMKLVQYAGISKQKVEVNAQPVGLAARVLRAALAARAPDAHLLCAHQELPWSTGLLDVWRDPEILAMSSTGGLCGLCMIMCLPAKTFVDVQNGTDVWKRDIDPKLTAEEVGIKGALGLKFTSPGWALLWNMGVLACCPPVRAFWRWRLRRKYVVQGQLCGDIISVTLCYVCATLQEAREVRVCEDELFTSIKNIDGAALPNTWLASYGVPARKAYDGSAAKGSVPGQIEMKSNA